MFCIPPVPSASAYIFNILSPSILNVALISVPAEGVAETGISKKVRAPVSSSATKVPIFKVPPNSIWSELFTLNILTVLAPELLVPLSHLLLAIVISPVDSTAKYTSCVVEATRRSGVELWEALDTDNIAVGVVVPIPNLPSNV